MQEKFSLLKNSKMGKEEILDLFSHRAIFVMNVSKASASDKN
jgi:hypothetical protein